MTMGKWQRNIVSMTPIWDSDTQCMTLYAVDNDGKAWTMISSAGSDDGDPLERKWLPMKSLPDKIPDLGWGDQYLKKEGGSEEVDRPDVFRVGDKVMIYDRYRFAFPLPGKIVRIGTHNDGIEVELMASNTINYPIGCNVWVHHEQLRVRDAGYHPRDHNKPYSADMDQLTERKNRLILELYFALRDIDTGKQSFLDQSIDSGIRLTVGIHPYIQAMVDNGDIKEL